MTRTLYLASLVFCLIMVAPTSHGLAQEDEKTTVHITIKEDGLVTTDTTFELKEGQDPEMVKEIVHHLAEGEGEHEIMIIESDEDGENIKIKKMKGKGSGHMMIISDDEHVEWTEGDDEDVNVYVIKKGDKDMKVVKKVTVEIEDESKEDVEKEVEVEVKTEKKRKEKKEQ